MPAVSGSPTQIQTSALNAAALAGTPDDQFKEGDVAFVASLYPNAEFILRRSPLLTAPNNVTTIATYSGNGYWELSPATFVAGGTAGLYNPALGTLTTVDATPTTMLNVIPAYLLASGASFIFDVTATVEGILDASNVYRVDLNATFTYDAATATLGQLTPPTAVANERFSGSGLAGMATIDTAGNLIITGVTSETWKWAATLSDFFLKSA
jgi:hypothetical protein